MWTRTNPKRMMPLPAITAFLPSDDLQNSPIQLMRDPLLSSEIG